MCRSCVGRFICDDERWIDGVNPWVAGALALLPLGIPAVVEQGIRSEVYGLQLLLSWVLLIFVLPAKGNDSGTSSVWLLSLAWPVPITVTLAFVDSFGRCGHVCRSSDMEGGPRCRFGWLEYPHALQLPLRSRIEGRRSRMGRSHKCRRTWAIISGKEWVKSLPNGAEYPPLSENVPALLGYVVDHLSPQIAGLIFVVVVLAVPTWVSGRKWGVLGVGAAILIPFASRAPYGVDLHNPDLGGYVASSFLGLCFLAAWASASMPERVKRMSALVLMTASISFVLLRSPLHARSDRSAERYARSVLNEVPIDGTLIISDYSTQFGLWSLRALEGARPDVALVFRGQVHVDWYARRLVRSHPRAADRLPGFPQSFASLATRWEPGVKMEQLGPLALALRPVGLTLALGVDWPSVSSQQSRFTALQSAGLSGRRFEALQHTFMIEHILALKGPRPLAQWHLSRLKTLAPHDPWTIALSRSVSNQKN